MKKIIGLVLSLLFVVSSVYAAGTLTVAKSASIANPSAAINFTYYIQTTCTGNCYKVQITDTLPSGFGLIGTSSGASLANGVVSWYGGDAANSMTNSSQTFTFYGNIPSYTIQNISNTAECFGTQGGDATSTTILAMATSTPVGTATPIPPTATVTNTPNGPQQTQTAQVGATKTHDITLHETQTAVVQTQTAGVVATGTAYLHIYQTATAKVTATDVAVLHITQTALQTATQIAQTQTAIVVAALSATSTPTMTPTIPAIVCDSRKVLLKTGKYHLTGITVLSNTGTTQVTYYDCSTTAAAPASAVFTWTQSYLPGNYPIGQKFLFWNLGYQVQYGVVADVTGDTECLTISGF